MSRDALLRAYRATRYIVTDGALVLTVEIDIPAPAIAALLRRHGASCGAFVTAWNPRSVPQSTEVNEAAHRRLLAELEAEGIRWLPHLGQGTDPAWPAEQGVLAIGLDEKAALALAHRHGQNAVVLVDLEAAPRLVSTRLMPAGDTIVAPTTQPPSHRTPVAGQAPSRPT